MERKSQKRTYLLTFSRKKGGNKRKFNLRSASKARGRERKYTRTFEEKSPGDGLKLYLEVGSSVKGRKRIKEGREGGRENEIKRMATGIAMMTMTMMVTLLCKKSSLRKARERERDVKEDQQTGEWKQ